MKKKFLTLALSVWLSLLFLPKAAAFPCLNHNTLSAPEIASILGWAPSCANLCGGYYKEPAIVLACKHPADLDAAATTITADHTVLFSAEGTSRLEGHVVVTQPGRKITADEVLLYRNAQTHAISQLLLRGNVHYFEAGKHLVSQSVFVDLTQKYVRLDQALYRLAKKTPRETLNAWGSAGCVIRKSDNDILLSQASYTTCPPIHPTWQVVARKLHLDRGKGRGEAVNTFLYVHGAPLIWIPYFSFPLEKQRKSGFLFPTMGYANNNGLNISFPYYLNLAPNYDATLIPTYIARRGVQLDSRLRYLTPRSSGNLKIEYIPYDRRFAAFRNNADAIYGVNPDTIPFLNRLHNDWDSRGWLSFVDCTHFNQHWWSTLDINYVTDDYYLQDFAYNPFVSNKDQLLNQAQLNYASDNWRFLGRIQTYQTLHPINQQPILDQYARIPQLFITSDYPERPNRPNFQINSEFVYFDHPSEFVTQQPMTTGQRLHVQPSISYPLITPFSFFIPTLQLDGAFYDLHNPINAPNHIERVLPIFDIDTGIYLERNFLNYQQTLEPRIFYLFVPNVNQNDIPLFDTTLPPFGFAQLFRTNRFVGYDRLGDANQVSFALTSRLLNTETGEQRLRASIGQTLYLRRTQVRLTPYDENDFYTHKYFSSCVGELNYNFNAAWDGVASVAVDPEDQGLNNASLQFHYRPSPKHIFNIGYDFVRKGDTLTSYELNSSKNNLNRVNAAIAWQLSEHWQALGNWNYNLSHGHPQAYFYGFQYDSCCWAMRLIASRIITAENVNDLSTYQTNYYVQLQLKGLGNIGNSDPGNLLMSSIFGYQDTFRS